MNYLAVSAHQMAPLPRNEGVFFRKFVNFDLVDIGFFILFLEINSHRS